MPVALRLVTCCELALSIVLFNLSTCSDLGNLTVLPVLSSFLRLVFLQNKSLLVILEFTEEIFFLEIRVENLVKYSAI